MALTKGELVTIIAEGNGISKSAASQNLDMLIAGISEALVGGNDVSVQDFGKFTVKETAERQGRNPKTGESITIPEGRKIVFKPSKTLKDALAE